MEVKGGTDNKFFVCLYEFLGTAFLMLGINYSSSIGDYKPVGIAATLAVSIANFGYVCGGHYNPAVTLAVFIREQKMSNLPFALCIIISEIAGGFFGMFLVYL